MIKLEHLQMEHFIHYLVEKNLEIMLIQWVYHKNYQNY